jgi:hypothetical protein
MFIGLDTHLEVFVNYCSDNLNHQFTEVSIVISKFEASGDRKRDLLRY